MKVGGVKTFTATGDYVGPGSYDLSIPARKTSKAGTFGTPKVKATHLKKFSAVPGPGEYVPAILKYSKVSYGFGSSVRPALGSSGKYEHRPGPGQYSENVGAGKGFSMGGRPSEPDSTDKFRASIPAPNTYVIANHTISGDRAPSSKIGTSMRPSVSQKGNMPGPGHFETTFDWQHKNRKRGPGFGSAKRGASATTLNAPGPAAYNLQDHLNKGGPRFSILTRHEE